MDNNILKASLSLIRCKKSGSNSNGIVVGILVVIVITLVLATCFSLSGWCWSLSAAVMEHHKQFRKQTKQLSDVLFPVPESQAYMLPRPEHFPPNAANASKLTDLQREIASQIPNFLIIGVQVLELTPLYSSRCLPLIHLVVFLTVIVYVYSSLFILSYLFLRLTCQKLILFLCFVWLR